MYHRLIAVLICFILILACGFALCAPVKTEPPKPIPNGPECYTQAKLDEALAKVHYRTIVEAYRKVGIHDPKWDDKAVSFLEGYAEHIGQKQEASLTDQLLKNGEELLALGCTDPMVLYAYASELQLKGTFSKAGTYFWEAMDGFKHHKYPKVRMRLAPLGILKVHKAQRVSDSADPTYLELFRKWNIEMLTDGSFLPGEERIALGLLFQPLEEFPYPDEMGLYEAVKQQPSVDTYIVDMVGGRCHVGQGWDERGTGWANSVTDEGWKGLEENLRAAHRLLVAAWKLHPEYPEAPTALIGVALGGHAAARETPRLWFDRAVAAQMDYPPAYSQYTWSIYPRWGGSHKQMYDFGVECLKTGRFDTGVPWRFYSNLNRIVSDYDGERIYWRKPETAEYVKQFCDGYEKSGLYGSPERLKTIKGVLLYKCGSCEEAKRVLDELGEHADKLVPPDFVGMPIERVREEVDVLAVEPGKGLLMATKLYDDGKIAEALAVCREVAAKYGDNEKPPSVVRKWSGILSVENGLQKKGWVDLLPDGDPSGWAVRNGESATESDGSVKLSAVPDRAIASLTCSASLGGHIELKGELDFVSPLDSPVFVYVQFRSLWRTMSIIFHKGKEQVTIDSSTSSWRNTVTRPDDRDAQHLRHSVLGWKGNSGTQWQGTPGVLRGQTRLRRGAGPISR